MPKDFNDYIRDKNILLKKRDIEIEKEVFEQNYDVQLSQVILGNIVTTAVLNLMTQPFNVMSMQLQLSSNPIENFKIDVKQIMESQYTIQQKRRLELVHKQFKPYPYYPSQFQNYRKALIGIAEQGIMGFFKGYKSGVLYSVLNSQFRFLLLYKLTNENKIIQNILVASVATLVDLITNPLQTIQTRLILQNRLPNFKTYHNFRQIIRSGGLTQGASGHIYKNIFIGLTQIPSILIDSQRINLIYMISTSLVFGYPFLTMIRRLQAQSRDMNMINTNYSGFLDILKDTYNNKGIFKLYKGFGAYATVNMFISSVLYGTQIFGEQFE